MIAAATPAITPEVRESELGTLANFGAISDSCIVDLLLSSVLHHELGDGVWDLLEQDRDEARVEGWDEAIGSHHGTGSSGEAELGHHRVRYLTDAGGFQRAEENVCHKLGNTRGERPEDETVVPRTL